MLGDDDAFALKLEIRALDGDDADTQVNGELANRWNFDSTRPFTDSDSLFNLLHDLQIHGTRVRLRDDEVTVHVSILSIYSYEKVSSTNLKNAETGDSEARLDDIMAITLVE